MAHYRAHPILMGHQMRSQARRTHEMTRVVMLRPGKAEMKFHDRPSFEIGKDLKRKSLIGEYFCKVEAIGEHPNREIAKVYYFTNPDTAFYFRLRWT